MMTIECDRGLEHNEERMPVCLQEAYNTIWVIEHCMIAVQVPDFDVLLQPMHDRKNAARPPGLFTQPLPMWLVYCTWPQLDHSGLQSHLHASRYRAAF